MGRRCAENKLLARWSNTENDIIFYYPRSCDGHLLHGILSTKRIVIDATKRSAFEAVSFDPSFTDELEKRGYDIKTLRFEISLKEPMQ